MWCGMVVRFSRKYRRKKARARVWRPRVSSNGTSSSLRAPGHLTQWQQLVSCVPQRRSYNFYSPREGANPSMHPCIHHKRRLHKRRMLPATLPGRYVIRALLIRDKYSGAVCMFRLYYVRIGSSGWHPARDPHVCAKSPTVSSLPSKSGGEARPFASASHGSSRPCKELRTAPPGSGTSGWDTPRPQCSKKDLDCTLHTLRAASKLWTSLAMCDGERAF